MSMSINTNTDARAAPRRLAAEPLELIGLRGDLAVHELDRHLALERGVERAIDGRHPTGPDLGVQPVAAVEQRADLRAHVAYCDGPGAPPPGAGLRTVRC
jgi:hypothetical protein